MLTLKRLMIFCAVLAYSNSAGAATLPACLDADVGCLKLHLVDQQLQIQDLTQQRDSLTGQLSLSNAATKVALDAGAMANNYAQSIAKDAQGHWYERPIFWFALGFLAASALSIGLAAAINHVTR